MANVFKQELVYGETKARTWPQEYQGKTGIICVKKNQMGRTVLNKMGQSLIHKTENLLDIICDNIDCPLRKEIQFLPDNHI